MRQYLFVNENRAVKNLHFSYQEHLGISLRIDGNNRRTISPSPDLRASARRLI